MDFDATNDNAATNDEAAAARLSLSLPPINDENETTDQSNTNNNNQNANINTNAITNAVNQQMFNNNNVTQAQIQSQTGIYNNNNNIQNINIDASMIAAAINASQLNIGAMGAVQNAQNVQNTQNIQNVQNVQIGNNGNSAINNVNNVVRNEESEEEDFDIQMNDINNNMNNNYNNINAANIANEQNTSNPNIASNTGAETATAAALSTEQPTNTTHIPTMPAQDQDTQMMGNSENNTNNEENNNTNDEINQNTENTENANNITQENQDTTMVTADGADLNNDNNENNIEMDGNDTNNNINDTNDSNNTQNNEETNENDTDIDIDIKAGKDDRAERAEKPEKSEKSKKSSKSGKSDKSDKKKKDSKHSKSGKKSKSKHKKSGRSKRDHHKRGKESSKELSAEPSNNDNGIAEADGSIRVEFKLSDFEKIDSISVPKIAQGLSYPMQQCYKLVTFIKEQRGCDVFCERVDEDYLKRYNIEQYKNTVRFPMDFVTITENLENDDYDDIFDFAEDCRLVFSNAKKFNKPNSPIYESAESLNQLFNKKFLQLRKFLKIYFDNKKNELRNAKNSDENNNNNSNNNSNSNENDSNMADGDISGIYDSIDGMDKYSEKYKYDARWRLRYGGSGDDKFHKRIDWDNEENARKFKDCRDSKSILEKRDIFRDKETNLMNRTKFSLLFNEIGRLMTENNGNNSNKYEKCFVKIIEYIELRSPNALHYSEETMNDEIVTKNNELDLEIYHIDADTLDHCILECEKCLTRAKSNNIINAAMAENGGFNGSPSKHRR